MAYCPHCGNQIDDTEELTPLERAIIDLSEKLKDTERLIRVLKDKVQPMYEEHLKNEETKFQRYRIGDNQEISSQEHKT